MRCTVGLFANVRQQRHEPGALDRGGDRVLADRGAARLATADNLAMAVDQLESCGIYFGTTGGQVYVSPDGGDSWQAIVENLPSVLSVEVQTLP